MTKRINNSFLILEELDSMEKLYRMYLNHLKRLDIKFRENPNRQDAIILKKSWINWRNKFSRYYRFSPPTRETEDKIIKYSKYLDN